MPTFEIYGIFNILNRLKNFFQPPFESGWGRQVNLEDVSPCSNVEPSLV